MARPLPSRSNPRLEELRHSAHICFAEAVRSAQRAVNRRYARHFAGLDINASQASLLMRLYYLGEPTMAVLAEQMEADRTTMVRNVAALERSGHVETVDRSGERAHRVRLTTRGHASIDAVLPRWQAAQDEMRAALGDDRWAALMAGMRQLVEIDGAACPRSSRSGQDR